MKKIILSILISAFSYSVQSADLPKAKVSATSPLSILTPLAATEWGGLYAGLNFGWAWRGLSDLHDPTSITHVTAIRGVRIGFQLGYDFKFDHVIAGIIADVGTGNVRGNNNGRLSETIVIQAHGGLRARLGYIITPNFLVYATGGVGYGNALVKGGAVPYDTSHHRFGYTLGGGTEYRIDKKWSSFIEYRYTDLGRWTYDKLIPSTANYTGHSLRLGTNYSF